MSRPAVRPPVALGSPHPRPDAFRLSVNDYLDRRVPEFVWFERLGLISVDRAEVVIQPGVIEVILMLAGMVPDGA